MRPDLEKQTAIVTGGGRGIGRAIVLRLARAGLRVATLARSTEEIESTAAAARDAGFAEVLPIPTNITRDEDLEAALRLVLDRWGRITVLVNNAGAASPRTPVAHASVAEWDRTLATCLRAPMLLSRLVLPDMLAHGSGAILNIASVAARDGRPGEAAYSAAKFGLRGFTQALWHEARDRGVKVCVICPGFVDTGMIPPNRRVDRAKFLQPEDIADFVYEVLRSPIRACPREIVIEPQFDPERSASAHGARGTGAR